MKENKKIMQELEDIKQELAETRKLATELNENSRASFDLLMKEIRLQGHQRQLEYEDWFNKNYDKISTTTNLKEEQQ